MNIAPAAAETMKPPHVNLVLLMAADPDGVIGHNGTLPWNYPEDLKHFKATTTGEGKGVIMGRATWESLPVTSSGEKLPGRKKIVITTSALKRKPMLNTVFIKDWNIKNIKNLARLIGINTLYIIGGRKLFDVGLWECDEAIITHVTKRYMGDTSVYITDLLHNFDEIGEPVWLTPELKVVTYRNKSRVVDLAEDFSASTQTPDNMNALGNTWAGLGDSPIR